MKDRQLSNARVVVSLIGQDKIMLMIEFLLRGHFLFGSREKDMFCAIDFKSPGILSAKYGKTMEYQGFPFQMTQAYRLYTLALSGNADLRSMNRLKETPNLSYEGKYRFGSYLRTCLVKRVLHQQLIKSAILIFRSKMIISPMDSPERN